MGLTHVMMLAFPAMTEIYKYLAVAVALYFPVAMLTWLAIDKLYKKGEEVAKPQSRQAAPGRGPLRLGQNPRQNA